MWAMYCSIVRVMCFSCEEGLGMHDLMVDVLVMAVFVLVVILFSTDNGQGMAVF